jgi:hypothetical protein
MIRIVRRPQGLPPQDWYSTCLLCDRVGIVGIKPVPPDDIDEAFREQVDRIAHSLGKRGLNTILAVRGPRPRPARLSARGWSPIRSPPAA